MKKIYNAPYMKVVEVKNDIIATSLNGGTDDNYYDTDPTLAPGRGIWDDNEF